MEIELEYDYNIIFSDYKTNKITEISKNKK